ncbi:MAG: alpha-hydroxy-acid oxidizing protein [Thermoplasmata archaeon]|nr:alpha-hydroxy-acid oxidizing protein [Thermoplasmata archaeon]
MGELSGSRGVGPRAPQETSEEAFLSLGDLEEAASRKVAPAFWNYVQGGAAEEITLRDNRAAFHRRTLRPRVLVDVTELDPTTTILGNAVRAPYFVCPTAYHGSIHPDAEMGTARAASAAGILAAFSTLSSASLEEIAAAAPAGPRWFQLYLQPEFSATRRLVERAVGAGYSAIVLTVDLPVLANRDRQAHGGFALAAWPPLGNGADISAPARGFGTLEDHFTLRPDTGVGWEIIDRLRALSDLPIVVKGILTADDASRAVEHGARAVIVSNHGGRQLDGAPASLDALPEVVAAVGSRAEVYLDGGVRRGSDIVMALGLGARAVGIGRPILWGLGAEGERGVRRVLSLLMTDLLTTMALTGRRRISEIDASVLGPMRPT